MTFKCTACGKELSVPPRAFLTITRQTGQRHYAVRTWSFCSLACFSRVQECKDCGSTGEEVLFQVKKECVTCHGLGLKVE